MIASLPSCSANTLIMGLCQQVFAKVQGKCCSSGFIPAAAPPCATQVVRLILITSVLLSSITLFYHSICSKSCISSLQELLRHTWDTTGLACRALQSSEHRSTFSIATSSAPCAEALRTALQLEAPLHSPSVYTCWTSGLPICSLRNPCDVLTSSHFYVGSVVLLHRKDRKVIFEDQIPSYVVTFRRTSRSILKISCAHC